MTSKGLVEGGYRSDNKHFPVKYRGWRQCRSSGCGQSSWQITHKLSNIWVSRDSKKFSSTGIHRFIRLIPRRVVWSAEFHISTAGTVWLCEYGVMQKFVLSRPQSLGGGWDWPVKLARKRYLLACQLSSLI